MQSGDQGGDSGSTCAHFSGFVRDNLAGQLCKQTFQIGLISRAF